MPGLESADPRARRRDERPNTPMQGTAADIIKIAMVRLRPRPAADASCAARMLLNVHDELVFECPTEQVDTLVELVRPAMERAATPGTSRCWSRAAPAAPGRLRKADPVFVRKTFSPEQLLALLEAEAARSLRNASERYCEGELPSRVVFTLDRETLCDGPAVIAAILRADGQYRPDVRIGPVAVTRDAVVLEVSHEDSWTDGVLEGELAFPGEPFILVGPPLPGSSLPSTIQSTEGVRKRARSPRPS